MDIVPKISVIIPCYNHGKFVGRAIRSVLDQDYSDFELLISDDCSQDDSRKIIESFDDPRITAFFQQKNLGPVYAIGFLSRHARGKYIALLNSDDYWAPEKLGKQAAFLDAHPEVGACFTQGVLVDGNERVLSELDLPYANIFVQPNRSQGEWLRYFWESGNALAHPSILIRREIYAEELLLNPALRQLPDMELWTRLIQKYPIEVMQESLFFHRRTTGENQNTSALTADNSARSRVEEIWLISRMLEEMPDALLQEGFSDLFVNPGAETPEQLCCERFFLILCHRFGARMHYPAEAYFMQRSMDPAFVRCMEDEYDYDLGCFFALTSGDAGAKHAYKAETSAQGVAANAAESDELRQCRHALEVMQNSTSWRITKPMRMLGDWLKARRRRRGLGQ